MFDKLRETYKSYITKRCLVKWLKDNVKFNSVNRYNYRGQKGEFYVYGAHKSDAYSFWVGSNNLVTIYLYKGGAGKASDKPDIEVDIYDWYFNSYLHDVAQELDNAIADESEKAEVIKRQHQMKNILRYIGISKNK